MQDAELLAGIPRTMAPDGGFETIYAQHYATVYNVAYRVLASRQEAEEVAQETFLKLFKSWPNLRVKTSLRGWLARVAINDAYTLLRGHKREQALNELLSGQPALSAGSAEEEALAIRSAALLALALTKLKHKESTCLILRHSGLSYQEIADVTGMRFSSVGKSLQRSEEKLRKTYLEIEKEGASQ